MLQQKMRTLTGIFSEVLANLAFMFTEDEDIETSSADIWLETAIGYVGPAEGALKFRCTREFSRLLAANLLGIDPDSDQAVQQSEDAVKEFMNIVCGQFVTAMHGSDHVFNLTIPAIEELAEVPDMTDDGGITTSTLAVDAYRVQLIYEAGAGQAN